METMYRFTFLLLATVAPDDERISDEYLSFGACHLGAFWHLAGPKVQRVNWLVAQLTCWAAI